MFIFDDLTTIINEEEEDYVPSAGIIGKNLDHIQKLLKRLSKLNILDFIDFINKHQKLIIDSSVHNNENLIMYLVYFTIGELIMLPNTDNECLLKIIDFTVNKEIRVYTFEFGLRKRLFVEDVLTQINFIKNDIIKQELTLLDKDIKQKLFYLITNSQEYKYYEKKKREILRED